MKADYILKAELLDIIFDERNKSYGAYPLRKFYHERLFKALGILLAIVFVLSMLTLVQKKAVVFSIPEIVTHTFSIPPAIPEQKVTPPAKPEKPKEKPAVKKTDTQQWVNKIITVDDKDKVSKLANLTDSVVIGSTTITGYKGVIPIIDPGPVALKTNAGNGITKPSDKNIPLNTADIMPAYPGGMDALRKFLERNLRTPGDISDAVSVKIKFVVGYDGTLKGFETIEDGGSAYNDEVIRVLKKMPEWIPGKAHGENVSVYYTIPVKFVPQE